jgi:hypothetical protein
MKITPSICPKCGERVRGTADLIPGICLVMEDEDGSFDYRGETKVYWDGQYTETDSSGRATVCCVDGHEWLATIEE